MAVIIIPARKGSTRLKNKLLLNVKNKPVIQWTVENCLLVEGVNQVIVATDSEEIKSVLKDIPEVNVVMTPSNLKTGSDRIAYVAKDIEDEFIINVQGDEPLIPPTDIENLLQELKLADITTLAYPISSEEDFLNPNIVKVIVDKYNYALYFSRSPIPFYRDIDFSTLKKLYPDLPLRHIGIYGYRKEVLLDFAYKLDNAPIEEIEKLEQLRLLYNNYKIKVIKASKETIGIDTKEDFEKFCQIV
ncbi:MAG: 3-deoxy-manno-octulosonate cytidylyltransferase [Aquificae bacterium]|nr:3-deoxy-manno-octulosonate cytidylyltransferase [Aquificota bacterium]